MFLQKSPVSRNLREFTGECNLGILHSSSLLQLVPRSRVRKEVDPTRVQISPPAKTDGRAAIARAGGGAFKVMLTNVLFRCGVLRCCDVLLRFRDVVCCVFCCARCYSMFLLRSRRLHVVEHALALRHGGVVVAHERLAAGALGLALPVLVQRLKLSLLLLLLSLLLFLSSLLLLLLSLLVVIAEYCQCYDYHY